MSLKGKAGFAQTKDVFHPLPKHRQSLISVSKNFILIDILLFQQVLESSLNPASSVLIGISTSTGRSPSPIERYSKANCL